MSFASEELIVRVESSGFSIEPDGRKEIVLGNHDRVDEDDLLGGLTHLCDTRVFLRLFDYHHGSLLDNRFLFLLRLHRKGCKQRKSDNGNVPYFHHFLFFNQFVFSVEGSPDTETSLGVYLFHLVVETFDV